MRSRRDGDGRAVVRAAVVAGVSGGVRAARRLGAGRARVRRFVRAHLGGRFRFRRGLAAFRDSASRDDLARGVRRRRARDRGRGGTPARARGGGARSAAVLELHAGVPGRLRGSAAGDDRDVAASSAARRAAVARAAVGRRAMTGAEDKRYDATPARRLRAEREGNVARSSEVTSLAAFAAAVLAAVARVPLAAACAVAAVREGAAHPLSRGGGAAALGALALAALAPAAAAACAGSVAALAQSGGLHMVAVRADPKRLDPIAGLKRMLGGEALVAAVRAALALAAALCAMIPLAREVIA